VAQLQVISVIIPVYRDAEALGRTLAATDFSGADVIVSSAHDEPSLAPLRLARPDIVWVDAPPGRAHQMNAGCFRFALDSRSLMARPIELGVRARVALFGLPYGDQAIFVRRQAFEALRGYADLPIMEDVDLVRRLRRRGRLFRSAQPAVTSARRWDRDGRIGRTARHLALITLYFCGVPPATRSGCCYSTVQPCLDTSMPPSIRDNQFFSGLRRT
jgi:hypothetical protein